MQRAVSALCRFSAVAVSIVIASVIPAVGASDAFGRDEQLIELQTTDTIVAALDGPAVKPVALDSASLDAVPLTPVDSAPIEPVAPDAPAALDVPTTTAALAVPDAAPAIERAIPNVSGRIYLSAEDAIVGIASFYDDPQKTASGEQYNPNAFTAAAQLEIRHKFGGVRYGRLYRPAYGLGEYGGKKIIVRFNDVGPLRPGRKFDLSRAAMAYFDSTLDRGLLPNFKMTPLPLGRTYPKGPVTDEQLAELGIDDGAAMNVCDAGLDETTPIYTASVPQPKPPALQIARGEAPKPPMAPPVIAKPAVVSKPAVIKPVVAKPAVTKPAVIAKPASRAAAKVKAARRAIKTVAARGPTTAAAPAAAPTTQDASAMTPWIRRVVNLVTSPNADSAPAQQAGGDATDKRRVVAQAR